MGLQIPTFSNAENAASNASVTVLQTDGLGVGGAIDLGHQHLLKAIEKPFISVVMAGDGQMDPANLSEMIQPILNKKADHVKGNRMMSPSDIVQMPKGRRRASKILGWLTSLASGRVIQQILNADILRHHQNSSTNGIGRNHGKVTAIRIIGSFNSQAWDIESLMFQ